MKVLVVGANGFLGKNLSLKLAELNYKVDMFDISFQKETDNQSRYLEKFINNQYDFIFHIAAYIPYGKFDVFDNKYVEINFHLTEKLMNTFKSAKIIFASSVSVYGKPNGIISENSHYNTPDFYGTSKLLGEFLIKGHDKFSILRFSSLYGIGMNEKTFLPIIVKKAIGENKITIWGDGARKQDYLHINDAVMYCLKAMKVDVNDVFLAVNGQSYSNIEVAEIIASETGAEITHTGVDNSPSFCYNNEKSREILGFKSEISIKDGIKELIEFFTKDK